MSNWIAIYDAPADDEPPFECLVAGDVVENCIWVSGGVDNYFQLCFSTALPLSHFPTHWRPAQSAAVKESLTSQEPVNVSTLTLNAADSAELRTNDRRSPERKT